MDEDYNDDYPESFEGSDIDNWEDEQVFQDREGLEDDNDYPIHEDSSPIHEGCD